MTLEWIPRLIKRGGAPAFDAGGTTKGEGAAVRMAPKKELVWQVLLTILSTDWTDHDGEPEQERKPGRYVEEFLRPGLH